MTSLPARRMRPIDWVFILLPILFMFVVAYKEAPDWLLILYGAMFVLLYIIAYQRLLSVWLERG
jgi:hypothetical protein